MNSSVEVFNQMTASTLSNMTDSGFSWLSQEYNHSHHSFY